MANTRQRGVCAIGGCDRPHMARGWCRNHYMQWKRTGDPLGSKPITGRARTAPTFEELTGDADKEGCWPWAGGLDSNGYGIWRRKGQQDRAHRQAWVRTYGAIPGGLEIDHLCHTWALGEGTCLGGEDCRHRRCVNPRHLQLTSHAANMMASRKLVCHQGHPLEGKNLLFLKNGKRRCRACMLLYQAAYRSRRKMRTPDIRIG